MSRNAEKNVQGKHMLDKEKYGITLVFKGFCRKQN